MNGIFISYRRQDSGGYAGRLYDNLRSRFGARVFQDVDSIADGEIFTTVLERALSESEVALTIIGPTWLTCTDEEGRRRLDDPNDWIRIETQTLLNRSIRVIPILVGGARMPRAVDLPEELRALVTRQSRELRDTAWDADVRALVQRLSEIVDSCPGDQAPAATSPGQGHRRVAVATVLIAFAVVAVSWVLFSSYSRSQRTPGSSLAPSLQSTTPPDVSARAEQPPPTAPAAAPQATSKAATPAAGRSEGRDPGTIVSFDLTRGRFLRPLPSDVKFYVQSPVEDRVTAASGRYARSCRDALDPTSKNATSLSSPVFLPATGTQPLRAVELPVPALSPNRDYCFAFTVALKPTATKLREIVVRELDGRLRDLYRNEQLFTSGPAFDDFRRAILSGLRDAAHDLQRETGMSVRLTVPNDSFFVEPLTVGGAPTVQVGQNTRPQIEIRPGVLSTSIDLNEREAFARLLANQLAKSNAVTDFNNRVSLGTNELARLRKMEAFRRIVEQLRVNIAQPLVQQRVPTEAAIGFAMSEPDLDAALASGVDVTRIATANNPDRIWEPAALEEQIANLDGTIAQAERFRQLVTELSTPSRESLRDAAGLGPRTGDQPNPSAVTAPEFLAVAQQVERVRQALLEAKGALLNAQRVLTARSELVAAAASQITADIIEVIQVDGTATVTGETRGSS
jgi:hypothetical protein